MKELNKLIEGADVSYPVRYEDGVVYDAKGWFICELMGGAEREPTEHEDSLGNLIVHALNNLQKGQQKQHIVDVMRADEKDGLYGENQVEPDIQDTKPKVQLEVKEVKVFRNGEWVYVSSVQPKEGERTGEEGEREVVTVGTLFECGDDGIRYLISEIRGGRAVICWQGRSRTEYTDYPIEHASEFLSDGTWKRVQKAGPAIL